MKKEEALKRVNPLVLKGIAHRGYHNEECTENGLKAFKRALDNNLAIELDVHVTKDNKMVVCHDSELKRTTGKEGIIEGLNFEEIRENYRLYDGGVIPTLQEVRDLVDEKVPLVIELKVYEKNYKAVAKKLKEELQNVKDKKNYMLISFDPRALFPFRKSGFIRSLLLCKSHGKVFFFRHFFESIDIEQVLVKEKKYLRYAKNHLINVWTIVNKEQLDNVINYVDMVTFQEMDHHIVQEAINNKK